MRQPYSAVAAADGTASIQIQPPSDVVGWRVTEVSVEMAKGTAAEVGGLATCFLRVNGWLVTPLTAQGDAASGYPPVDLEPGDVLTVEWASCREGNVCSALAFYEPLERETVAARPDPAVVT